MDKIFEEMKAQAVPAESTVNALIDSLPEESKSKRRIHFPRSLIAAAAALSVLTVSAGAATNWTFGILPDPSSVFADEKVSEYNAVTEAVYSNTVTDYGFELIGAVTDGHLLNVIVDIYPPEGHTFSEDNIPPLNSTGLTFQMSVESETAYGMGSTYKYTDVTPKKLRAELIFDCSIPMDGKQIKLYAGKDIYNEDGNTVDFETIWEAELTTVESKSKMTYENIDKTQINFSTLPEFAIDQESYIIPEKIDVSFMSLTIHGKFSIFSPGIYLNHRENYARLADGSTVALTLSDGTGMDMGDHMEGTQAFAFAESVDPENVVSIVIDGHEIVLE